MNGGCRAGEKRSARPGDDSRPELLSGKATIRLRPQDAAALGDGELLALVRAALD